MVMGVEVKKDITIPAELMETMFPTNVMLERANPHSTYRHNDCGHYPHEIPCEVLHDAAAAGMVVVVVVCEVGAR